MKRVVPLLLALAAPALGLAEPATWNIDPAHTQATFKVRHLVISTVTGEFKKTSGVVKLDDKDLAKSSVEAKIDAASIHTREDKRDEHLRSPDFFDVQKYPEITFASKKIEKKGDRYRVTGDLTMHGVTKPVVLDTTVTKEIQDPWGMTRRGIQASTQVDRREFGLTWSKTVEAGPVVGDEIQIEINAELIKAPEGQQTARAAEAQGGESKAKIGAGPQAKPGPEKASKN
jgi:polyisoprenoid-binding protein YceI